MTLPRDNNRVPYQTGGRVSESGVNTTTTALGSGATFTGTWETNPFPDVMVSIQTDNSGTLYFDFSNDGGTNSTTFPVNGFKIASGTHQFHTAVKGPRSVRVRLVNDSGAQSYLRLYTYFGTFRQGNAPLNQSLSQTSDAIVTRTVDSMLDISIGRFSGFIPYNKFGRAPAGVQSSATDIWDRADATPTQSVWTAPTAARTHSIVSTSDEDSDSGGSVAQGNGARTIRIFGLKTWDDTGETTEDITMDGTNAVNTANSYVIIYRMRVLTSGTSGPNVGTITATAATDSTVTAQMNATEGSTLMAIFGIPSTQTAYITQWYATINKAGGAVATIDFRLRINSEPDTQASDFVTVDERGLQSTGTSSDTFSNSPYRVIAGPAIIKVQGIGSTNDIDASGGFDMIIVDN